MKKDQKEDKIQVKPLKLDFKNLPQLKVGDHNLPKPPPVYPDKKDKDESDLKLRQEFTLKNEFDLNTYSGRFQKMWTRINPSLFWVSNKTIEESKEKVEKFKMREEVTAQISGKILLKPEEIQDLKRANAIVESSTHPDTGKIIPFYMRMSGFVYFNVPLVLGVLFKQNQTPGFNAFMQWMNQTYNASMNYGNRNATSNYTMSDLGKGYVAASLTSMGIALYTRTIWASWLKSLHGAKYTLANAVVGYLAGASAGAINLMIMRYKELQDGIKIQNNEGDVTYGNSKIAAKQAIMQTAFTRFILPLPVLFLPAIGQFALQSVGIWPKNNIIAKTLEFSLVVGALTVALPGCIALFNQRTKINKDQLELEFQEIKGQNGEIIHEFYFNKGL